MRKQWLAIEHYRLHVMEDWPDSARKESSLESVRSAVDGLTREISIVTECMVCAERRRTIPIGDFRPRAMPWHFDSDVEDLTA